MLAAVARLPLFILLMGAGALAMLVPAVHARLAMDDLMTARMFFYGAILLGALATAIGMATRGYAPPNVARSQLSAMAAAFAVMPVFLALPFWMAGPARASFFDAWWEMVSCFTTTGGTLWDNPARLSPSLHLWRGLVGWLGGLFVWVAAVSILAPLNLGGFEVRAPGTAGQGVRGGDPLRPTDPSVQMAQHALRLVPVYAGLTILLWAGLVAAGEPALTGLIHAMSTMSTSGISAIGGPQEGAAGLAGEALILIFLVFALSRRSFGPMPGTPQSRPLWQDAELGLGLLLIAAVTAMLFLRHFLVATEERPTMELSTALQALWGGLFTVASFLTTTGFESREWLGATDWSGLPAPGLLLLGLAIIGGGVATTAGGVKLLRVYALIRHGQRELERLVHPSSVGGAGAEARRIRRQGAYIAWIFFVIFVLSILTVMLLLSVTGVQFETAMVLTVAVLSTTGPLAQIGAANPISFAGLPEPAQAVLAVAMVVGRLETLALIALFNPDFWRR
jgi:trk system potassium uptake protein TrkH